jgi:hypothetical protein
MRRVALARTSQRRAQPIDQAQPARDQRQQRRAPTRGQPRAVRHHIYRPNVERPITFKVTS